MKQKLIELLEEVLERLDPNDIHNPALISKVKRQILRLEDVEEVRHISKLQESAEELPYAVRNLNLPDLKEDYLEEKRHLIELNEHKNFARQDLEDEEIDRLAREEVERSLYEDGIIEDPDCDGGLLG